MNPKAILACLFLTLAPTGSPLWAGIRNVSTATDFQTALNTAAPGDEIVLAPGTYAGRFAASGLKDVLIRSADPGDKAVIAAANEGLKIDLSNGVTVEDLVVKGAKYNGINISGPDGNLTTGITLRRVEVYDTGGTGNEDGIKLSAVADFLIDNVTVSNWGTGGTGIDMVGCHRGLIENSYLTNPDDPMAGFGIRPKGGSTQIRIRANRFDSASERPIQFGGITSLNVFRPSSAALGPYEADAIVAEGNTIVGGRAPISFANTVTDTNRFSDNLSYGSTKWAGRILMENKEPGFGRTENGVIKDNVFVWSQNVTNLASIPFNVGSDAAYDTFTLSGNEWYNQSNPGNSTPNLAPVVEQDGIYGVDPQEDPDGIFVREYAWGKWIINNSLADLTYVLDDAEMADLLLALPLEDGLGGSDFDVTKGSPLSGNWNLVSPRKNLDLDPLSYYLLVDSTVPEPTAAFLLGLVGLMAAMNRKKA